MAGACARCRTTQRVLLWLIHPMRVCAVHVGRYKVGMSEGFAWTSPYVYVGVVVRECGWVRVSVAVRRLTMSGCACVCVCVCVWHWMDRFASTGSLGQSYCSVRGGPWHVVWWWRRGAGG